LAEVIFLEEAQFRRRHREMRFEDLVSTYRFYEDRLEEDNLEPEWREIYTRRLQILQSLMGIEAAG